ncbi:hypothetical protein GQ457_09G022610 [Hibiscus cannabinus]
MLLNNQEIVCDNQKRKHLRGCKFIKFRSIFDTIAYTPCFVSLYNVAIGEQISRMRSTGVHDKICKDKCPFKLGLALAWLGHLEYYLSPLILEMNLSAQSSSINDGIQLFKIGHSLAEFMIIKGVNLG